MNAREARALYEQCMNKRKEEAEKIAEAFLCDLDKKIAYKAEHGHRTIETKISFDVSGEIVIKALVERGFIVHENTDKTTITIQW